MRRLQHGALAAAATIYLLWRLAVVVGAPSPANVLFLVVEILGWIGLGSFLLTASSPHATRAAAPTEAAPVPVVAVLAGVCSPYALERTLASLEPFPTVRRFVVVDPHTKPGVLDALATVAVAADALLVPTELSGLHGALDALLHQVADDEALVLVRGGSLLTADGLDALVAPMRDPSVGGVQGGLGWADGSKLTLHGPSREGLAIFVEREGPAAGAAGVAPLIGDGTALRVRAVRAVVDDAGDLGVAMVAAGWVTRFARETVVCRPRPASAAGWRIERTAELADRRRRAVGALVASGLDLRVRVRMVAAAGDIASAFARVGLLASVVMMLIAGRAPVPGSLGSHLLLGSALWVLGTVAARAVALPVLRFGDRLRLGWHRLDADVLAAFTRAESAPGRTVQRGRFRSLAWFPLSVAGLVAVDLAGVLRGLALIRSDLVGSARTPIERATIGAVSIAVLVLLFDALRVFVGRLDAREDLRIRSGLRVEVTGLSFGALAEIVDLSSTGAGLSAAGPVQTGDRLHLRFALPDSSVIDADAVVSRVVGAGHEKRVGVVFEALPADLRRSLVRYVAASATTSSSDAHRGLAVVARPAVVGIPRPVLRFLSVLAVVVTSASLVVSPAGAAPLAESVVTGTVTGPDGPTANVCVNAVTDSAQWYGTQTDSDGAYTLAVSADSYRIQFRDCRGLSSEKLLTRWWASSGLVAQNDAEHIQLNDGDTRSGIDAALQPGGWFAGSVQTPAGDAFDGACVNPVSVAANNWDGGTNTPSNGISGHFETDALAPGQYRVHLSDCSGQPELFAQGWVGSDGTHLVATQDDAKVYDLADANVVLGPFAMAAGTRLAGIVRDETGAGVSGICVGVDTPNWNWGGGGSTGPDGSYVTDPILAGTWVLRFEDCRQPASLVNTFFSGHDGSESNIESAARIQLDGSVILAGGFDQTMQRGGTISGVVSTDEGPVAGACVNAVTIVGNSGNWLAGTQTASDGTFHLGPVAGDHVTVQVDGCQASGVIGGVYAGPGHPLTNSPAQAVTFVVDADHSVDNLQLHAQLGAILSGVVTAGGTPMANACVSAVDPETGFIQSTQTGNDGAWSVSVQSGSYLVGAYDCVQGRGHAARYAPDAIDPSHATRVVAVGGQTHAPVDIDLPTAAQSSITGRVVTASGAVPTACVIAIVPNQEPVAVSQTNTDGTFTLGPLDAGAYLIGIVGCDFSNGTPPGVTDPVDPSITYPLQWSSGAAVQIDNIWLNPPWVTAQAGAVTDLGTMCLSPCRVPPPGPPAPEAVFPNHLGANVFDPDGFDIVVPPAPPIPSGSITAASIESIAPSAKPGAAKPADEMSGAGDPASNVPVPTLYADRAAAGPDGSMGGSASGWWFFGGAGLLGLGAAVFPRFRARRLARPST